MSPPPSNTWHLHWAQVPPPPQAEERKILFAARVCSSLLPAGTVTVRSSLIRILTSPVETSLARAIRIITTSASTMAVNIPMARKTSKLIVHCSLELYAGERHKAQRHQTNGDKGNT